MLGTESNMAEESSGAIRSVERAAALIQAIADAGKSGSRLTDLALATGLSKTTVHRLLGTLTKLGWVELDESRSAYVLGLPLVGIGMAASDRHGFTSLAAPHLNRLAELTSDTVYLTVKTGSQAVCVDRVVGTYPIRAITTQIGERRMLGSCAGSLALLAWAEPDEVDRLLTSIPTTQLSGSALPDPAALPALIQRARTAGFTQAPTTLVPGAEGIGVPIIGGSGTAIAAFSVEAVSPRLSEPRRTHVVEWMKREATVFAQRLQQLDGASNEGTVRKLLQPGTA
ncbi:transcriptional regulator, IclR family protein (plasmid) [Rhodococcus jostii RHA1]|uniref:Glycerol operon regulatory protein n=2 Tax=Rhodococcus jostii TaxID=132919 RepID=Q0RXR1_RHOJR|nr:transcriptional regulator, IclR family protein [Rhodococcus jostii RHA1]